MSESVSAPKSLGPNDFSPPGNAPAVNAAVHHPSHYTQGEVECIDAIASALTADEYRGYLKGSVIKYLWRERYKHNPHQDCSKAKFYLEQLLRLLGAN